MKKKFSSPTKKIKKSNLKNCLHIFKLLQKADGSELKYILPFLNKEGRKAIYDCIFNAIYNDKISEFKKEEIRQALSKDAKTLKYLANTKRSEKRRRKVLTQRGGNFLPLLLSAAIPLITSLFNKS